MATAVRPKTTVSHVALPDGWATARCPCRIDLFGTWSDDREFLPISRSRVVSCAVLFWPSRVPTEVTVRTDGRRRQIVYRSFDRQTTTTVDPRQPSANPIVWAVVETLRSAGLADGLSDLLSAGRLMIVSRSRVPYQSGLGASGSLTVCARAATLALLGRHESPRDLAEASYRSEDSVNKVGWQDHYAAACGGTNLITRGAGDARARVKPLPAALSTLLQQHAVLVFVSNEPHGALTWPRLTATVSQRLLGMDAIIDELLRAGGRVTIDHLIDLLSRHWTMARHWYPRRNVDALARLRSVVQSYRGTAVYVGAGPAALCLSPIPAGELQRVMRSWAGVRCIGIIPTDVGVSITRGDA